MDARETVLARARDEGVVFVHLQFMDILGITKTVAIPATQLERALAGEIMFDGSSIEGFVRIEESDRYLAPDPSTYAVFPWDGGNTCRLICDLKLPDGSPFPGCPRSALQRALDDAARDGFTFMVGAEPEFFLFQRDDAGRALLAPHDRAGYFDQGPMDRGHEARRDMVLALAGMGFSVEAAHHEVAPGQHEIDFTYAEALRTADNIATFRFVVRTIALQHGLHATFMPKPIHGQNGSGMHIHQSLHRGEKNAFAGDAGRLSETGLSFIAGVMGHIKAITAIANPLVNSYKRLVAGYEAPVYIAWSAANRSPLIRVPASRGEGRRLELRSPDPSCNPYLTLAACLAAGMEGVRSHLKPPAPVDQNIYRLSGQELRELGIESLPGSIHEAVAHLRQDALIRRTLGEHITRAFVEAKEIEWEIYQKQVHAWEVEQYLEAY